jgi:hypothetical protein
VGYFSTLLSKVTGLSFSAISTIILALHNICLLVLLVFLTSAIIRLKKYSTGADNFYFLAGTASSLAVIALLLFLSLINEPYKGNRFQMNWTYVYEERYYAFPVFFIQQAFFILLSKNLMGRFRRKAGYVFIFIGFIIAVDSLHNIYYTIKIVSKSNNNVYKNPESPGLVNYITEEISAIKKENPGKHIVVFPLPVFTGTQAGFYQGVPFYFVNPARLPVTLKTQHETVIVFILRDKPDLSKIITNKISNLVKRGQYNNYHFFTMYVLPG